MPDTGLKQALDALGLKQAEFARLLDVSPRTVSQWATGSKALPGTVSAYLRLLAESAPEVREKELKRLDDRSRFLEEGVYRIGYHGFAKGEGEFDQALAVLRNGKILGSDRHGGIYTGSYCYDRHRRANALSLRIDVPPHGMLVNGHSAGEDGAEIDVACHVSRPEPRSRATIRVAGQPIDVEFTYLGPLPH